MATAEDLAVAALARCAEFSSEVPSTRSVLYRRLSARQQALFAHIAALNADYTGRSQVLALAAGAVSLDTLAPAAERVTNILVSDPGASGYVAGQRVNLVTVDDPEAASPPRAYLRDHQLTGYNGELDLVTSVTVNYCRRPPVLAAQGDTIDLPDQFHELLVVDLTKHLVKKMMGLGTTIPAGVLTLLDAEEAELLADLDRHVKSYDAALQSRYQA